MKCVVVCFLLMLPGVHVLWNCDAQAQTKRALLVGINHYKPAEADNQSQSAPATGAVVTATATRTPPKGRGTWMNLDGCVNDVEVVRNLLIGRFGFAPGNITLLSDSLATREGILAAIRQIFIDSAAAGDELFFMYAGHGSQVVNSKSPEPDKKDETLVPSDACKGTPDIRDKEIKKIFNEVLNKPVVLTLVFDCCHSGSIARGMPKPEKTRFLEPDTRDIADPDVSEPGPEERGALILSAAQDMQLAAEASDENDLPHGAFSLALIKALRTANVREPVEQLFARVKAIMQSEGRTQEPVLAGPAERRRKPLIGGETGTVSGTTRLPVLRTDDRGRVTLLGGLALGLAPGCELKKMDGGAGEKTIRLTVTNVPALNRSEANVKQGSLSRIAPGDMFEVDRWASSPSSGLRVWIPPQPPGEQEISKFAGMLAGLGSACAVIDDPTHSTPTCMIEWDGKGWTITGQAGRSRPLGRTPAARAITEFVKENGGSLFVNLPPLPEVKREMEKTIGTPASTIRIATRSQDAHYLLVGRRADGVMSYAWILPNVSREDSAKFPLPVRTDWIAAGNTKDESARTARRLCEFAQRIEKLRGWLLIDPPPDEGRFPYALALKNSRTGEMKAAGTIYERESYGLVLRTDSLLARGPVERRYVYVFAMDSYGNSTLLFPRAGAGNIENRIPYDNSGSTPIEIPIGRPALFTVGPPFGLDTYLLLTSEQALPDPDGLAFEGVRTRGNESTSGLSSLLTSLGSATRGPHLIAPADWSLQRMFVRSSR